MAKNDREDDGTMWRDVPDRVRDRWHREASATCGTCGRKIPSDQSTCGNRVCLGGSR